MQNTDKSNSKIIGFLFILAAISSIIGLILYDPILQGTNYLTTGREHFNQIILGAICELILVVSVVGTAIMLFPYLKKQHESLAIGYVCFRLMESVVIVIGIVSILALLTLSQSIENKETINQFQPTGIALKAIHDWTFMLGPNFFLGINTLIYSYLFFKSDLIPKFISVLGMVGAILIFSASILEMFHVIAQISVWGIVLALPIFAYEMSLAVWLIVKGFKKI